MITSGARCKGNAVSKGSVPNGPVDKRKQTNPAKAPDNGLYLALQYRDKGRQVLWGREWAVAHGLYSLPGMGRYARRTMGGSIWVLPRSFVFVWVGKQVHKQAGYSRGRAPPTRGKSQASKRSKRENAWLLHTTWQPGMEKRCMGTNLSQDRNSNAVLLPPKRLVQPYLSTTQPGH